MNDIEFIKEFLAGVLSWKPQIMYLHVVYRPAYWIKHPETRAKHYFPAKHTTVWLPFPPRPNVVELPGS